MKLYSLKFIILFLVFNLFFSNGIKANVSDISKITVTITEKSGQELKNYQVLVNLSESNFSFDSDKNKLSFADENSAKLDYWVEEWDASAKEAKIWVKIPILKANETKTIYMDLEGDDLPNGEATFDFFDDFEDYPAGQTLIGKNNWFNSYEKDFGDNSKNVIIQSGESSHGEKSLRITSFGESRQDAEKYLNISYDVMIEYDIKTDKDKSATYNWVFSNFYVSSKPEAFITNIFFDREYDGRGNMLSYDARGDKFRPNNANPLMPYNINTWYNFKILAKMKEKKKDIWINDKKMASGVDFFKPGTLDKLEGEVTFNKIGFDAYSASSSHSTVNAWFDNVRIRKYVFPEPEVILGDDLFIAVLTHLHKSACLKGYQLF